MSHLSVSQLQVLMRCPKEWWFKYVRKEPEPLPPSEALRMGKAFHGLVFENTEPPEDLKVACQAMKEVYTHVTKDLPPVRFAEVEIRTPFDTYDYLGYVDAVRVAESGAWYLTELKTRSTLEHFDARTIDYDLQLGAYILNVHTIATRCGLPERAFGGVYYERVTKPKRGKPPEVDILFRRFDDIKTEEARRAFFYGAQAISVILAQGDAPKNQASCTRYGERCPFYEKCYNEER